MGAESRETGTEDDAVNSVALARLGLMVLGKLRTSDAGGVETHASEPETPAPVAVPAPHTLDQKYWLAGMVCVYGHRMLLASTAAFCIVVIVLVAVIAFIHGM